MTSSAVIKRADPSTFYGKVLVGYQGWFDCPSPERNPVGAGGWLHWFNHPLSWNGGRPNFDLTPDVSDYSPSELYVAEGLKTQDGKPVHLFSSRNPKTVQRHFNWMAKTGIDGAFLQRFLGQCDVLDGQNQDIRDLRDEVGDRVREAAEQEGRVFALMYDVNGVSPERMLQIFQHDWPHIVRTKGVLDSPNYLRHEGKPVLSLWGLGFGGNNHSPWLVHEIVTFLRNNTPGGLYLIAGSPTHWRTSSGDADSNPEFVHVWMNEFDCISPWTVGRFKNEDDVDGFYKGIVRPDIDFIHSANQQNPHGKKIDYFPVVLPGGSGSNLSEGRWQFNDTPRQGGRFLWRQLFHASRLIQSTDHPNVVKSVYGAMWDEYDEGTAFLPAITRKRMLPIPEDPAHQGKWKFLSLDAEGHDLPSDWYMRVLGFFGESLRGERRIHEGFPSKDLQDYWSSRPKYESAASSSSAAGSSSAGASAKAREEAAFRAWLEEEKKATANEPPPPVYSLEAEEEAPAPTTAGPAPASLQHSTSVSSASSSYPNQHAAPAQPAGSSALPLSSSASIGSITSTLAQTTISSPLPSQASSVDPNPNPYRPDASNVTPVGFAPPPTHPSRLNNTGGGAPGLGRYNTTSGGSVASQSSQPPRPSTTSPYPPASGPGTGQWPPSHWNSGPGSGEPSPNSVPSFPQVSVPSFPSTEPSHGTGPSFPSFPSEPSVPFGAQQPPHQYGGTTSPFPGQGPQQHSAPGSPGLAPTGSPYHQQQQPLSSSPYQAHAALPNQYGSPSETPVSNTPSYLQQDSNPYARPGTAPPQHGPERISSPYHTPNVSQDSYAAGMPDYMKPATSSYGAPSTSPGPFGSPPQNQANLGHYGHPGPASPGQDTFGMPDYMRPQPGGAYGSTPDSGYGGYGGQPQNAFSGALPHAQAPYGAPHFPSEPQATGSPFAPPPGPPPHLPHHQSSMSYPGHTTSPPPGPGQPYPPHPSNLPHAMSPPPPGQAPAGPPGQSSYSPQYMTSPPPPPQHPSMPPRTDSFSPPQQQYGYGAPIQQPYGAPSNQYGAPQPPPSSYGSYNQPSSSSSKPGGALGYALSTVDKYAGKKVASQVGSLANSGGKLLGKFSK
ncbi:hypothetical protein DL96DRAFT_1619691 [Flagelloscypha sp. PMI_526]|nr:hypothetical protein DL96DRAFT_1619691 [Flagelloscypha sp. PMI_526]